jgi:hypothetical protein
LVRPEGLYFAIIAKGTRGRKQAETDSWDVEMNLHFLNFKSFYLGPAASQVLPPLCSMIKNICRKIKSNIYNYYFLNRQPYTLAGFDLTTESPQCHVETIPLHM